VSEALTRNETEVLALLREANCPMTAYQLLGRMRRNGGAVAPPTVYRALKGLEAAGLVRRIETLRAWALVTAPAPGEVAIRAAEHFCESRETNEVHGRCGDGAGRNA